MTPITLHYFRQLRDIRAEQWVLARSGLSDRASLRDSFYHISMTFFGVHELTSPYSKDPHWWAYFLLIMGLRSLLSNWIDPYLAVLMGRWRKQDAWDVVIDDAGFHLNRPITVAEKGTDAPWSWFRQIIETEEIFLIRVSWKHHFVLPKHAFTSPEALDAFRALARAKMPEKWGEG